MAKYDGLIIPRSYNDYINKSDPAGVSQALQLTGVMDAAPTAASTKPAKSGGIFAANAVIMASSATLTGVAISAGSVVRVLFTAALTGSDATTGLILTYNGNAYAVKVGKNGALAAFVASEISSGVFKYLQAYTTLELAFDGSQFVVMGNPVVISNADFSIMADGSIAYTKSGTDIALQYKSKTRALWVDPGHSVEIDIIDNELIQIDAMFYGGVAERALFSKMLNLAPVKKTLFSDASPGHSMSIEGNKIILTATGLDVILFDALYLFKY